jgi:hypothetical protein
VPLKIYHETFEWARFIATIVTPFAVFWLGVMVFNRRTTMENIDKKISEIRKEILMAGMSAGKTSRLWCNRWRSTLDGMS